MGGLEDFKHKEGRIRSAFLVILPALQGGDKLRPQEGRWWLL